MKLFTRRQTYVPPPIDETRYVRTDDFGDVQIDALDGVKWFDAPIPPRGHECWVQMRGWSGLHFTERCACGGIRVLVPYRGMGHWMERNTRVER